MLTRRIFALAGNPAGDSYFPHILRLFFHRHSPDCIYTRISASNIDDVFVTSKLAGLNGLNLISPFRVPAVKFVDSSEECAEKISAVNTILFSGEEKKGYNTEYTALQKIISLKFGDRAGRAVIMGIGADSMAVSLALSDMGWNLAILNKTLVEAVECAVKCGAVPSEYDKIPKLLKNVDLVIYADNIKNFPFQYIDDIKNKSVLFLNPEYKKNKIICEANLDIIPWEDFVIAQASAAYNVFTGENVDASMEEEARQFISEEHVKKKIYSFIGFSSTGKTTCGRELARMAGFRFVDLDEEIEKKSGKKIAQFLDEFGYEKFQQTEEKILSDLCKTDSELVISCGCDTVLSEKNRNILKEKTYPIWLVSSSEMLVKKRSLFCYKPEPGVSMIDTINSLFENRNDNYAEIADLVIKSDIGQVEKMAESILKEINSRYFL